MKITPKLPRLVLPAALLLATNAFAQQQPPAPPSPNGPDAVLPAHPIPPNAPHAADIRAARQVAEGWIQLLDQGKFDLAYQQMGQAARQQISEHQWKEQLKATRSRYGKLESRIFQNTDYATTLKGAPAGQYVILDYLCTFTSHQTSPETIVMAKTADGWRVAGFRAG